MLRQVEPLQPRPGARLREQVVDVEAAARIVRDHPVRRPRVADAAGQRAGVDAGERSEEHTSELQSLMRISYAVFCLKTNITKTPHVHYKHTNPKKNTVTNNYS